MTPKERAAMQQALKAMKDASPYGLTFKEAIIACEEALAEHERMSLSGITDILRGENAEQRSDSERMEPVGIRTMEVRMQQAELKECRHCGFLCKPNPDESRKWYPLEQAKQEPALKSPLQLNNDEIIKSVKNSLNIYAFTAEALEMLIDNVKREERKALGENNGKRTMDGNSECGVTGCNADCCVIGNAQEPLIDLSKIKHEDKCRYWDDERFCDCGADSHELLKWYRKNAAPVQQAEQEPVAWALSYSQGIIFSSKYPMRESKEIVEQMAREHMGAVVVTPLYAAPVRTKDLTDEELWEAAKTAKSNDLTDAFRAVIAVDREKNK